MNFLKYCPKCLKSYTNGAIGTCGNCRVDLIEIRFARVEIEGKIIKFVYTIGEK